MTATTATHSVQAHARISQIVRLESALVFQIIQIGRRLKLAHRACDHLHIACVMSQLAHALVKLVIVPMHPILRARRCKYVTRIHRIYRLFGSEEKDPVFYVF